MRRLEKLLNERKYQKQSGLSHLKNLLKKKSTVAYSTERITEDDAKGMLDQANKLSNWANTAGNDLKIEGWRL